MLIASARGEAAPSAPTPLAAPSRSSRSATAFFSAWPRSELSCLGLELGLGLGLGLGLELGLGLGLGLGSGSGRALLLLERATLHEVERKRLVR